MPKKTVNSRDPKVAALSIDGAYQQRVRALTVSFAREVLCGWVGQDIAKFQFDLLCGDLKPFMITNSQGDYHGNRQMLWEFTRKVLGKDTLNYAQEVGDCTSFSGKNVMEYLQCVQIALGADQEFNNIFPPYFYGCSRVLIGGGGMWGDGSSGVWTQAAIKKYGTLSSNTAGVPAYTGGVARDWGKTGPPPEDVSVGQQFLLKTTSQVKTSDDVANALYSGYPVSVCSDWGYNMKASSDGFMAPSGTWNHAMSIIGFDDSDASLGLYFIILNSWGDVHGQLKDFKTGVDLPAGVLRIRGEYVNKMVAEGDSFAYSQFDGFPDNSGKLTKALFDLVGD